jgi:hypothetical protein
LLGVWGALAIPALAGLRNDSCNRVGGAIV